MPPNPRPFGVNSELQRRVDSALGSWTDKASIDLLSDISRHVDRLNAQISDLSSRLHQLSADNDSLEPAAKRRKTPQPPTSIVNGTSGSIKGPLIASIKDVSFTIPVRKKCTLEIYGSSKGIDGGAKVVNPSGGNVEAELAFSDVEQATVTPLPERASLTYTYCLLPRTTSIMNPPNAIVFSASPSVPPATSLSISYHSISSSTYNNFAPLLNDLLNAGMSAHGKTVVDPSPDEFMSNIVQAHRKDEKSWCTKAWKGSKEGHLYPLSPGLLFGFKKPVLFFPFSSIKSVSYTSVLQRTFNMVLTIFKEDGVATEDVEFSMLDQQDFAPMDEWVKKHGLDDESLAKDRQAKVYGVNKTKAEREQAQNGDARVNNDGETDLARAERELQDAEDEEEKDFDPGSEGDSDGSGSDSEQEDAGDGGVVDEDMDEDGDAEEEVDE